MNDSPCQPYQDQLDEALHALRQVRASQSQAQDQATAERDFAQLFYADIGELTDAKRRYRAAVRALTECLSHQVRPD